MYGGKMDNFVYSDPALKEGHLLRKAIFVKGMESWVIQSDVPKTGNIDEYEQLLKENVLKIYPELKELFELEIKIDHTICFVKGVNSGKWFDFHTTG